METVTDIREALRRLNRTELEAVRSRCSYLIGTKQQGQRREEEVDRLIREHQAESGEEDGAEWRQPVSSMDAAPRGAVRTFEGERWRSLIPANPHQPGVAGWRLEPTYDDEGREIPPRYVQPSSAADSYRQGERITWTDGTIREAALDGVAHSPDEYAADWQLVEPEPEPEPDPPEEEEPTDPEEPEPGDGDGDEDPEPEEPSLPEWKTDVDYQPGDRFTYNGAEYVVLQAHTSAAHWPPDQVASLYERQG